MTVEPGPTLPDVCAEIGELRTEVERLAGELAHMRAHASLLESLALEDPLTGLLNRRGLFCDLSRAIAFRVRYGTPVALLLADLDSFKPINDEHGHDVGDKALVHLASILRGHVRASDSAGRLGGDEFALILWQMDGSNAGTKRAALEAIVARSPLVTGGLTLPLAASIGIAMLEPGDTPEAALARADQAMYARKAQRKAGRD